ncbi:hypothetical protein DC31_13970 [Microbacterium sp. CH12i]|uniref:hypothetical protein n=1 Tax=Microbacterium sp. CH12i TaxID=1479651 RepID=UPI000460FCA3|nr:hypothetical protein [Microbacterium sp. CH12i]KDA05867.1 hypothetical protein DC31_13970 [Microbacterium sp. CH12i]
MNKIWFPNQRAIRTAVQVVLALASGLGVFLLVAPQVLEAVREFLPESWYLWLIGFIAFVGTIAAALSRIMAIPQVDAFLRRWGAGSAPADAAVVVDPVTGEMSGLTRRQFRDLNSK